MAANTTDARRDFLSSADLEVLTGVPASTWRYLASVGRGPASFKAGRRRLWRRETVEAWMAEQEAVGGQAEHK